MAKDKVNAEAEEKAAEAKINAPRPELIETPQVDRETLSHNWQPGSMAVDLRQESAPLDGENVIARLEAELKAAKEAKYDAEKEEVTKEEWNRRTKLDVSDIEYINPSLDRVKVK